MAQANLPSNRQGIKRFTARNGRAYELDVANAQLKSGGKTRELPPEMAKALGVVFERHVNAETKVAVFKAVPAYQRELQRLERTGTNRKLRVTTGTPPAGARLTVMSPTQFGARSLVDKLSTTPLFNAASPQCIELSESIYTTTQELNALTLDLGELLEMLEDAIDLLQPPFVGWPVFIVQLLWDIEQLQVQAYALNRTLDVMATMWNVNNCWDWQGGGGGGDGSGGSGGGQQQCHDEWQVLEQSNDGGETWFVAWEGYVRICVNVT